MKISGELQFKPNECKFEYEDNCLECIHFICLDDNNTIECNYEDKDEYSNEETEEDSEVTTIGIHFMASSQEY